MKLSTQDGQSLPCGMSERGDALFDVLDLVLLLVVCLHLVGLVLTLRSDVCCVITTVSEELLLQRQVENVGADLRAGRAGQRSRSAAFATTRTESMKSCE